MLRRVAWTAGKDLDLPSMAENVKQAEGNAATAREKLEAFDQTIRDETDAIVAKYENSVELERVALAPKRGQIHVQFVALGWDPR